MEEEIKQVETISVPETPVQLPKKSNLSKIVPLFILGLIILAGAVYAGVTIGRKQSPPEIVPQITEVSPTPDSTATWKTYTNSKFFIRYPNDWIVYQAGDTVKFQTFPEPSPGYGGFPSGDNDIQVGISVTENIDNLTLQQYFEKLSQGRVVKSKESVLVDGIPAVEVSYDQEVGAGTPEIYLVKGNYVVEAGVFGGEAIKDEALLIFDQILSTFKFLDSTSTEETANWKTYRNEKYGFEFKYPNLSGWTVKENDSFFPTIYNYDVDNAPGRSWSPKDGNQFKIEIHVINDFGVNEWFEKEKKKISPVTDKPAEYFNIKPIIVSSQKGIYFETKDPFDDLVVGDAAFQTPKKQLIVFWSGLNFPANKSYFDQILSTFKFLD